MLIKSTLFQLIVSNSQAEFPTLRLCAKSKIVEINLLDIIYLQIKPQLNYQLRRLHRLQMNQLNHRIHTILEMCLFAICT